MAKKKIHVGDWGTDITITLKDGDAVVDVSAATPMTLKLRGGKSVTKTKTLSFVTDGTDGLVHYVVEDDAPPVFDVEGEWTLQVLIVTPSGSWHSDKYAFRVYPNL